MQTYKFCDVIRLLAEDNTLKFETINYIIMLKGERLVFIDKKTNLEFEGINKFDLKEVYTIYKEPPREVDYIEALKAYRNGKNIKIQKVNNRTKELSEHVVTSDMNNFEFCLDDLQNGKWFII